MFAFIRNFLNGLAFGITETIPGVSGGTIAIILGFYSELIETINHFFEDIKKRLQFLIPLILGAACDKSFISNHAVFYRFNYRNYSAHLFKSKRIGSKAEDK